MLKPLLRWIQRLHVSSEKPYQHTIAMASEGMVQIADPVHLSHLIADSIHSNFEVSQVGILLRDSEKSHFTFRASTGRGTVPAGLVKMDADSPFIQWFSHDGLHRRLAATRILTFTKVRNMLEQSRRGNKDPIGMQVIQNLYQEMQRFHASVVAPSYYKDELMSILVLGSKTSHGPYTAKDLSLLITLSNDVAMTVYNARLFTHLKKRNQMLQSSVEEIEELRRQEEENMRKTVNSLAEVVVAKDRYTGGHLNQVARLGLLLGEHVYREKGIPLTDKKKEVLLTALRLHDVGKVGTPDAILHKNGKLDDKEWEVMRDHVNIGARILEPLGYFKKAAHIIQHHHENWDGSGYPHKLKGEEIPIESRIIAVVDAYHAMTSNRPYHKAISKDKAVARLKAAAGDQFDPHIVDIFIRVLYKKVRKAAA